METKLTINELIDYPEDFNISNYGCIANNSHSFLIILRDNLQQLGSCFKPLSVFHFSLLFQEHLLSLWYQQKHKYSLYQHLHDRGNL